MLIGTWRDRNTARDGSLGIRYGDPGSGTTDYEAKTLPSGVFGTDNYASIIPFNPRVFVLGQFSQPLVLAEDMKLYKAGIPTPPAPTLTKGSGTLAGKWRVAITFAHVIGSRTIAESALSSPSLEVDLGTANSSGDGSGGLHFSELPATCVNPRVNRIRGYASFEGALFRRVWERPIGITSIDDTTAVLAEGIESPASDTTLPPLGALFGCVYGKRMVYAGGDIKHPYRAYYSEIDRPEAIEGFWDTVDRDPITGVYSHDEVMWMFTKSRTNTVRGYTFKDFVVRKISNSIGCVSHHGLASLHGWLMIPAQDGYWGYQGGFRYLMDAVRDDWRDEIEANPDGYDRLYARDNRLDKTFEAIVPRTSGDLTLSWCGHYDAFISGQISEPSWTRDRETRLERVSCCTRSGVFLLGAADGFTRRRDDTDPDDDGDSNENAVVYMTGPQAFGQGGGDLDSGKELLNVSFFVEAENNQWTAQIIGGDEGAYQQHANVTSWTKTIAASQETATVEGAGVYTYVPKSVHFILPDGPVGRNFFFKVRCASPLGFRFRGVEGNWKIAGHAQRVWATLADGTLPTLTTPTSTDITTTTVTLGGTVTGLGTNPVATVRGVCYSKASDNSNPTVGGTGVSVVSDAAALGVFTEAVTGLVSGTVYKFKAYCQSGYGIGYSAVGTFTTS